MEQAEIALRRAGYGRLSATAKKVITAQAEALRFAQEIGETGDCKYDPGQEGTAKKPV
ncbi:MAG: hypothetical protein LBU28_02360 [Spirochaetaceae bacterium]|nr:hypothetical protein [Spirochaetaceae bacterium]